MCTVWGGSCLHVHCIYVRMYEGVLLVLRVEYCMGRKLTGIAS